MLLCRPERGCPQPQQPRSSKVSQRSYTHTFADVLRLGTAALRWQYPNAHGLTCGFRFDLPTVGRLPILRA